MKRQERWKQSKAAGKERKKKETEKENLIVNSAECLNVILRFVSKTTEYLVNKSK